MYACNVKSFIYYEHHPNDYVMEHTHNCYECVFYIGGKGMITADNDLEEYDGPTITIVRPGIKHDETTKEFSRLFIVLFEFKKDELFKPFTKLKLDKEVEEVFLNLFSKMQEEEKNKKAFYRNMISSYFSLVLCHLLRKVYKTDNKASYNEELVNRTKNYIKENYNQKIDFEQIASSFGYSYHRFRHIFQKETNTSINQYLLNCKLYAAKQMLISTDMQIKEIAINCGFENNIHFNNFFKSRMNITPLQFRNASNMQTDVGVFKIKSEDEKEVNKKLLIIDTDIGGDCDDAGALALANIFKNEGLIDLLGMTFTTSTPYGPASISAINRFYGNDDIEIASTSRKHFCDINVNPFQKELALSFPNKYYDERTKQLKPCEDAIKLLRRKLANATYKSVTFVCIGQLNNVSDLLDSSADEYSLLNGVELVKNKVKEFVIMGGLFKTKDDDIDFDAEYNIVTDIKSARNFIKKVPTKVTFLDYKVGYKIKTGATLLKENNTDNPVTVAYQIFQNAPRESWDLLTTWFAIFGEDDMFKISEEGTINIDEKGVTAFDNYHKSNHYYLTIGENINEIINKIDQTLLGGIYEKQNN